MNKAHDALLTYWTDLHSRYIAQQEWKKRHPDWQTDAYEHDYSAWWQSQHTGIALAPSVIFTSSFQPSDLMPSTSDVITVELLLNLLRTTLDAYQKAHES